MDWKHHRHHLFHPRREVYKRTHATLVRAFGPANVRKAFIARNLLGFRIPKHDGAVAGGRSIERTTGYHELTQCSDWSVAVLEVVARCVAGNLLVQYARSVNLYIFMSVCMCVCACVCVCNVVTRKKVGEQMKESIRSFSMYVGNVSNLNYNRIFCTHDGDRISLWNNTEEQ